MKILKAKAVDVSTKSKSRKAFKILRMFNQKKSDICEQRLEEGAIACRFYLIGLRPAIGIWDYVEAPENFNKNNIIQPSSLKILLAKELLKKGDIIIFKIPESPINAQGIGVIESIEGDIITFKNDTNPVIHPFLSGQERIAGIIDVAEFKRFANEEEIFLLKKSIAKKSELKKEWENMQVDAIKTRFKFPFAEILDKRTIEQLEKIPTFLRGGFDSPLFSRIAAQDLGKGRSLNGSDIGGIITNEATHQAFERLLGKLSKKLDDAIEEDSIKEPHIGDLCRFWNTDERFPKGQRVGILTLKKRDSLMKMSFQENEKQWYEYATPITIEEAQKIFYINPNK
jgi:hypothetical protein